MAATVAIPPTLDTMVIWHEPLAPVVQLEEEGVPRFVVIEIGRLAWLLEAWIVMVDEEEPSAGTEVGVEERFKEQGTTVTCTLGVLSPNHVTPSWTICHWRLYVPGEVGAVRVKLKAYWEFGETDVVRSTLLSPQLELSCGF